MSISHIIKFKCPVCEKPTEEKERYSFGSSVLISLKCGHSIPADNLKSADNRYEFKSTDDKSLRPYQIEGIKFAEESNVRCLIADEQGLGKTVQSLGVLRLHPELTPAVIVTKTTIKRQWYFEVHRWAAECNYRIQVIQSKKERAIPGLDVYIISWDLAKNEGIFSLVKDDLKTLILDECQQIKNHLSDRAKAIQDLAANIPHVMATSGTPIKNNAGEYFTILNILQPARFPTYQGYINKYCDAYESMYSQKIGGLANPEQFYDDTKDFIIRRLRKEVAPEIPEVDRQFFHVEFNKSFHNAYREGLKELEELMYSEEDSMTMATQKIAIMTKLRKITGLSKVPDCIDFVEEFLENEPDRKLVIFAHHHDVVNLLVIQINKMLEAIGAQPVLNLTAALDGNKRAEIVEKFKSNRDRRIMIASTLSAGEGLNLQFCSRAIMLERQWNPANEEQAEGRFARIGQTDNIVMTYMIALGTIDEYFTELVEAKRAIVANTLDKKEMTWNEEGLMKELAETLVSKGMKAWRL
jgi:SWI/SNF-related matrix-associated actin-dependent regulator 1 of chromatin subfamily A